MDSDFNVTVTNAEIFRKGSSPVEIIVVARDRLPKSTPVKPGKKISFMSVHADKNPGEVRESDVGVTIEPPEGNKGDFGGFRK